MKQIRNYNPSLKSIKMIEDFVIEHSGEYTRTEIWKNLPRGMMYQTYKKAFDYLVDSNKIIFDRKNKAIWIFDPKLLAHLEKGSVVV